MKQTIKKAEKLAFLQFLDTNGDLNKIKTSGMISAEALELIKQAIKSLPHPSPAGKKSGAGTVKAAGQKQLTV